MKRLLIILLFVSVSVFAHDKTHWIEIGEGTYKHGFVFPYKLKLSVPYGVRDIEDIKEGLYPMKFSLNWLPISYSKKEVESVFLTQLKNFYPNTENFKLSKNLIHYFLKKLPSTKRHDKWTFIYYPDEGTKLYIDDKKIHQLVGAELNRTLVKSWLNKSPVLTSKLFNRLLKLQK